MNIADYLREHTIYIVINFLMFAFLSVLMFICNMPVIAIFCVFLIWFLPLGIYMGMEYYRVSRFVNELSSISKELDQKYLTMEIVNEPFGAEETAIYDILREIGKNMLEQVSKYEQRQEEYRDYIETWVHEIKTPIASASLIINNNKNSVTRGIESEINKIDNYVEQVLYYSKVNTANQDYIIKKCSLDKIVKKAVSKNSRDLILRNFSVELSDLDFEVNTDSKWVEFILNQIIGNSVKYSRTNDSRLIISSYKNDNNTVLKIKDNGIGIPETDINKIFIKGFTGENGRLYGKSTGLGLYICKNLCNSLGIDIEAKSVVGEGTEIRLIFPIGKLHSVI